MKLRNLLAVPAVLVVPVFACNNSGATQAPEAGAPDASDCRTVSCNAVYQPGLTYQYCKTPAYPNHSQNHATSPSVTLVFGGKSCSWDISPDGGRPDPHNGDLSCRKEARDWCSSGGLDGGACKRVSCGPGDGGTHGGFGFGQYEVCSTAHGSAGTVGYAGTECTFGVPGSDASTKVECLTGAAAWCADTSDGGGACETVKCPCEHGASGRTCLKDAAPPLTYQQCGFAPRGIRAAYTEYFLGDGTTCNAPDPPPSHAIDCAPNCLTKDCDKAISDYCRSDYDGGIRDGGSPDAAQTVTVTPAGSTILTCSEAVFTATVAPSIATESFTWSTTAGTIKPLSDPDAGPGAHALFAAPSSVDAGLVTISATATVKPSMPILKTSGSTSVTLADFDPQPGDTNLAPPATLAYFAIDYPHAMASLGNVVYAPFPVVQSDGQTVLGVWKSMDGGKSWGRTKGSSPPLGIGALAQYWSTAVDAVDPKTVYVAFQNLGTTGAGDAGATGTTLFFMVSTDGGDTFTTGPLLQYGPVGMWQGAGIYFPDVISPAGGSVVVMTSDNYWGQFWFWSDKTSGAGLTGGPLPFACPLADWCPPGDGGVTQCLGPACLYEPFPSGNISVVSGFQQPKFFTDGKGAICMAYLETPDGILNLEPVVQCSPDLGVSWAPLIHFTTPAAAVGAAFPSGTAKAVGAGKDAIALTWSDTAIVEGGVVPVLHVAVVTTNPTSPDALASVTSASTLDGKLKLPSTGNPYPSNTSDVRFDSDGVLWLVYSVLGGSSPVPQTVIDKSCDNGVSWKGGTFVGSQIDVAAWQGLVPLSTENGYSGGVGISAQWGGSPTADGGAATIGEIFYRVSP